MKLNVVLLGLVSLFGDIASEMVVPLLPAFLLQIGSGAAMLGLIEGASDATANLLKYLSGRRADRSRRLLPMAVAGYAISGLIRPALALAGAGWHVLAVRCIDRVGKGIRTSPRDKLLASSAPPERLAEAFAFHRGMDHLGAAIGPLVAAALLALFPGDLRLIFILAAAPGLCAVGVLYFVREEDRPAPAPAAPGAGAPARVPLRLLFAIGLFALGNSSDALLLLRARALGVPLGALPLLWTLLHVVRASASWPLGRLADRLGRRGALAAGWAGYALCYMGFAAARTPAQVALLFAAYGLVAGLTEGSERALVAASVPEDRRGRALGQYHLVSGAGLLCASVAAGQVWEHISPAAALAMGAALAAAASVLLLWWRPSPRPA